MLRERRECGFLIWEFQIGNPQLSRRQGLLHSKSSGESYCPNRLTQEIYVGKGEVKVMRHGVVSLQRALRQELGRPSEGPTGILGVERLSRGSQQGDKAAAWGRWVGTGGPQTERACRHSHRGAQPGFPSVQEKNRNNTEKMDLARPCRWKKKTWPPPRPTGAQGLVGTGRGRRHETTVARDQVSPQPVDRGSESIEIKFPTPAVQMEA